MTAAPGSPAGGMPDGVQPPSREPSPLSEARSEPGSQPEATAGLRSISGEEFHIGEAIGGWRGLTESVAPGLVFVVVFVVTRQLVPAIVASLAVAALAVLARLLRRSSLTYALGGVVGVLIGAVWAWRSGEAENYYAWGFVTNAAFALAAAVSLAVRRPLVGVVVSSLGLQRSLTAARQPTSGEGRASSEAVQDTPVLLDLSWRHDPDRMRRYTLATWLWCGAFLLRLAVQVPLYLGGTVGWLGTARLVMGLPMWALVLWVTWLLVRGAPAARAPAAEAG